MYNKVELCGVNTSRLRVLTNDEIYALLRRLRAGDLSARDELVCGNLRLVLSVIQRFANRGEMLDDLFQVGCIGLIKSIDNFNLELDVKFSTYAVPMIIGEVRRYLRDHSMVRVSRSLRDLAYRAMQARERFMAENAREPSVDELARLTGAGREEIVFALDAVTDPVSLYEPLYSDGTDAIAAPTKTGSSRSRSTTPSGSSPNASAASCACAFTRARRRWRSPVPSASARRRSPASKRRRSRR